MAASVFSLTKQLSGNQWGEAYEILLDLNGKYAAERYKPRAFKTGSNMLMEYALDLRVIGNARSAENLEGLTAESSNDGSILLLLALLADNPKPAPSFGSRVFPMYDSVADKRKLKFKPTFAFVEMPNFGQAKEKTPILEETDVILSAAKRLLDHKRTNDSGTYSGEENPWSMSHFVQKKLAPIRSPTAIDELSRMSNQSLFKPSRYPEPLQKTLHLLLNGASEMDHKVNNLKTIPNSTKLFREAQDANQMCLRRIAHFRDCVSCSKHGSGYAIENTFPDASILNINNVNKELHKRAELCGRLYENLVCFSSTYCNSPGRVLSAVASFVLGLSQDYLLQILNAIKEDYTGDSARLNVIFAAEEHKENMLAVAKLLALIERSSGSACAVLDILYCVLQKSQSVEIIHELFFVAFSPYVEMIWDWGFYASSARDYGIEYFGTILGRKVTDSEALQYSAENDATNSAAAPLPKFLNKEVALFILRAGRSRGLLETIIPNHHVLNNLPPVLSVPLSLNHANQGSLFLSDCVNRPSVEKTIVSDIQSAEALERNELSCLTKDPRRPYSVEDVSRLKEKCFVAPEDDGELSTQLRPRKAFPFSELKRIRNSDDGNSTHVQVCSSSAPKTLVEQRIVGILRRMDISIQREIMKYFVEKIRVFDHLKVIGDLALLGAGDFAVVLVQQLCDAEVTSKQQERFIKQRVIAARTFYGSSGPGGFAFRKRRHLAACLRVALNAASTSSDSLSDNFHISVESGDINQSSLWEGLLKVEYEASFPLSMIISPEALSLYSKYFNFFLSLGRAQRCLRSLFLESRSAKSMRGSRKTRGFSVLSDRVFRVRLWQFCWHAQHFVTIVGGYEFDQIHGISRINFENSWKDISSVWELRDAHMSYLNDSIRRVLLGDRQKSVMGVIAVALKIIIEVEEQITDLVKSGERHTQQTVERLLTLINTSTDGIKRRSTFLVDVLEKLVATGSHPHLQDFLTRLNFNFYYKRDAVF